MLSKAHRLSRTKDIVRVIKRGKLVRDEILTLRFLENREKASRFAFVVSLKVSKKAFLRNKARRQMREAVRLNLKFIKAGFDVMIKAEPSIKEKNFFQIKDVIESLLRKAKLL